jgi:hypothetical protein
MDPVPEPPRLDFERNGDQFGVWSYHHRDFRVTIDHFHDLARALSSRDGEMPWSLLLDQTIALVLREFRRVERATLLDPAPMPKHIYHLGPLIPKAVPTVFYGDGETGKSLLILALALSAATGDSVVPGIVPVGQTAVLYLDWEADRLQHADRLHAVMAGSGLRDRGPLHYLGMKQPLADTIPFLRSEVDRLKIGLVVIDSFAYACGPEPESDDPDRARPADPPRRGRPAPSLRLRVRPQLRPHDVGGPAVAGPRARPPARRPVLHQEQPRSPARPVRLRDPLPGRLDRLHRLRHR